MSFVNTAKIARLVKELDEFNVRLTAVEEALAQTLATPKGGESKPAKAPKKAESKQDNGGEDA